MIRLRLEKRPPLPDRAKAAIPLAAIAVTLTCYGDAPSLDVQLTLALFG